MRTSASIEKKLKKTGPLEVAEMMSKLVFKSITFSRGGHNQIANILNENEKGASIDKTPSHDKPALTDLIKLLNQVMTTSKLMTREVKGVSILKDDICNFCWTDPRQVMEMVNSLKSLDE